MESNLKKDILKIFPKKQSEIFIKVLEGYNIERDLKNNEYRNLLNVYTKLKTFQRILDYEKVQNELNRK